MGEQLYTLRIKESVPDDINILAKRLNVIKTPIEETDLLLPLIKDFYKKNTFKKELNTLYLDGVGYDIWYVDSGTKAHFSLIGGEKFEKGESPTITWARNLNNSIKERKSSK